MTLCMRLINRLHLSESSMYAPESVANPRTPNIGLTFFCSERDDKVRAALKTKWEVVAGNRRRLERGTTRERIRVLAVAVFREGIIGLGDKGLDYMVRPLVKYSV